MHRTRLFRIVRRLAGILAALAATLLATASAAFALPAPPMTRGDRTPPPPVQTVMVGGMPGRQIAMAAAASSERAAHAAMRYPRAFIEWKLSAGPPQQCA